MCQKKRKKEGDVFVIGKVNLIKISYLCTGSLELVLVGLDKDKTRII